MNKQEKLKSRKNEEIKKKKSCYKQENVHACILQLYINDNNLLIFFSHITCAPACMLPEFTSRFLARARSLAFSSTRFLTVNGRTPLKDMTFKLYETDVEIT